MFSSVGKWIYSDGHELSIDIYLLIIMGWAKGESKVPDKVYRQNI